MNSDPKHIAVIGAGGMGRFHAATIQGIPGAELVAIADPFADAAALESEFGVEVSTEPDVIAAGGYDGVIIASPDNTHAGLTRRAIEAGSRVLCEKPLSHNLEGARDVVGLEVAAGSRLVQVGFMRQYDPAHVAVAEQMTSLGKLHYLRCTHRNTNADARPPETVIVQSLIHDINTVRWLAGEIVEVDARAVERPGGFEHVLLVLRLASGATATVEFSDNTFAYEVEVEATADRGMVTTSAPQRPRLRVDGDHRTPIGDDWFGWFADAYRVQDRAWVASLEDTQACGPAAWDGLAAQFVAEAALTSLSSGKAVAVEAADCPDLYLQSPHLEGSNT